MHRHANERREHSAFSPFALSLSKGLDDGLFVTRLSELLRQPARYFFGVFIGRKDRIENFFDFPVADDERQPLNQRHRLDLEGRDTKRSGESKISVAQQLEREVKPLRRLALILRRLCRETEDSRAERLQFFEMISERARLRRASARAGNLIPTLRRLDIGPAGARITVDHGSAAKSCQVHAAAGRRAQRNRRHAHAGEMIARAVVDGDRKILGNLENVVASGHDVDFSGSARS
jgi:hypothetical protein